MTGADASALLTEYAKDEVIPRKDAPAKVEKDPKPEFKDVQLQRAVEYLTGRFKTAVNNPVKKAG